MYYYLDPKWQGNIDILEFIFTCGKMKNWNITKYQYVMIQFKEIQIERIYMHLIFQFKTNKNLLNTIFICVYIHKQVEY
jgi:hypothetical protein